MFMWEEAGRIYSMELAAISHYIHVIKTFSDYTKQPQTRNCCPGNRGWSENWCWLQKIGALVSCVLQEDQGAWKKHDCKDLYQTPVIPSDVAGYWIIDLLKRHQSPTLTTKQSSQSDNGVSRQQISSCTRLCFHHDFNLLLCLGLEGLCKVPHMSKSVRECHDPAGFSVLPGWKCFQWDRKPSCTVALKDWLWRACISPFSGDPQRRILSHSATTLHSILVIVFSSRSGVKMFTPLGSGTWPWPQQLF